MKKLTVFVLMVCFAILTACGNKGPDLNSLAIHSIERTGDKAVKVEASFDKEYEAVTVDFHSDIDNDTFTGEAIYTNDVGDVKPGEMYNIEVKDDDKWAFSGTFRQVRVDKDGPQIVPPDMKPEKIKVTVKSKGKELIEGEAEPKGESKEEKED